METQSAPRLFSKQAVFALVAIIGILIASELLFQRLKQIGWTSYDLAQAGLLDQYKGNSIRAITFDSNNHLWVGTYDYSNRNAVAVLSQEGEWIMYPHSDPKNAKGSVSAVVVDHENRVWVGTRAKLDVLTPEGSWETILNDEVFALAIDQEGRLWAGMKDKLAMLSNGKWQYFTSENSEISKFGAKALTFDQQGQLWTTDGFGIDILKPDGSWTKDAIGVSSPFSGYEALAIDEQGKLWAGSIYGLYVCDNGECSKYTASNSGLGENMNSRNEVYDLAFDRDNKLWVSKSDGLRILDINQALPASLLQGILIFRWVENAILYIMEFLFVVRQMPEKDYRLIGALGGGQFALIAGISSITSFGSLLIFTLVSAVIGLLVGAVGKKSNSEGLAYFGSGAAALAFFFCIAVVFGAK